MRSTRRLVILGIPGLACRPGFGQPPADDPMRTYERASGGQIGVHAVNAYTGKTLSWRSDERFVMSSSYKVLLVAFVLARVDRGEERLDALVPYTPRDLQGLGAPIGAQHLEHGVMTVGAMCKAAVEFSDGLCANMLMSRSGGPSAVTAFLRSIGDSVTHVNHYEPALHRVPSDGMDDSTTPTAMASSLRQVVLGKALSDRSKSLLTRWLVGNQTSPRLRSGLPRRWTIGNQTAQGDRDMAGDVAVAWSRPRAPIVMVVYTRGGRPTEAQFDAAFASVSRLIAATIA